HLAALVGCSAGGDERARATCGLDHDDTKGQTRDNAVASREVVSPRLKAGWLLADEASALADGPVQVGVLRRIDDVESPSQNSNGAGFEGGAVGGRINAQREPRYDDIAGLPQAGPELPRELLARCRGC